MSAICEPRATTWDPGSSPDSVLVHMADGTSQEVKFAQGADDLSRNVIFDFPKSMLPNIARLASGSPSPSGAVNA